MSIFEYSLNYLDGKPGVMSAVEGNVVLLVNVASKCGLTPQYEGLERLHEEFGDRGFSVLGVPCNQFAEQEPGSPEEIAEFCSTTYGVTFPMTEKVDVNGDRQHPMYAELQAVSDGEGHSGDIRWNFEKFLIAADGSVAGRFSPMVTPEDATLREAIERLLP